MDVGATLRLAVFEVVILQQTLAGLVADWAVNRVVDQQSLFDSRPAVFHQIAGGDDHSAILGWCLTRRDELRHHRYFAGGCVAAARFDETHPATRHDR